MNKRPGEGLTPDQLPVSKKRKSSDAPLNGSGNGKKEGERSFGMEAVEQEWRILEEEAKATLLLTAGPRDRFQDVCKELSQFRSHTLR